MFNFFCFVTCDGEKHFFGAEQREHIALCEQDNPTTITNWFFTDPETAPFLMLNEYQFNPFTGRLIPLSILDETERFEEVLTWVNDFTRGDRFKGICHTVEKVLSRELLTVDEYRRCKYLHHPAINQKHLLLCLRDPSSEIKEKAARHYRMTSPLLSLALRDASPKVRYAAVRNTRMTASLLATAVRDPDPFVRWGIARSGHATEEILSTLMNDLNPHVRVEALQNENITPRLVGAALSDCNEEVRLEAAMSDKIPQELQHVADRIRRYWFSEGRDCTNLLIDNLKSFPLTYNSQGG
jgi:hypothetical protein